MLLGSGSNLTAVSGPILEYVIVFSLSRGQSAERDSRCRLYQCDFGQTVDGKAPYHQRLEGRSWYSQ